jgi:hypothetical protein
MLLFFFANNEQYVSPFDAPLHSLKDSNASSKMKTMKDEGVGVRSLVRSILGVGEQVQTSGWGLR